MRYLLGDSRVERKACSESIPREMRDIKEPVRVLRHEAPDRADCARTCWVQDIPSNGVEHTECEQQRVAVQLSHSTEMPRLRQAYGCKILSARVFVPSTKYGIAVRDMVEF